jgi:hypothetical protein
MSTLEIATIRKKLQTISISPGILEWGISIIVFLIYMKIFMGRAFFSTTYYIGDAGDTNQYQWYIGWIWYALTHQLNVFVTNNFYYPHSTNIMIYTSVPTLGFLFGWMHTIFGMSFTQNIIYFVNWMIIFVFGKLFLKQWGIDRLFSSLGGFLFIFTPYLTFQGTSHLNLTFMGFHFIIFYLVTLFFTSSKKPSLLQGLFLGGALLCSFYTFLETFTTLMIFFTVLILFSCTIDRFSLWNKLKEKVNVSYIAGIVIPMLLALPGIFNYFTGQSKDQLSLNDRTYVYVNDLSIFIAPSKRLVLHNNYAYVNHFTGNDAEWNGYLSIPLIILATFFIVKNWENKRIRLLLFGGITMGIFSLGPHLHIQGNDTNIDMPWFFMQYLPLLGNIIPSRMGFYAEFAIASILVIGAYNWFSQATDKKQINMRYGLSIASILLVALFWLPNTPYPSAAFPDAAKILSDRSVADTYIRNKHILYLTNTNETSFNEVMGILAASNNYDTYAANVYGSGIDVNTPPFLLTQAFSKKIDNDPKIFASMLESFLPHLEIDEVAFIGVHNNPIPPVYFEEINKLLGQPMYNNGGKVIFWSVPSQTKASIPNG